MCGARHRCIPTRPTSHNKADRRSGQIPSSLKNGLFLHLSLFTFLRLSFKLLRSLITLLSNVLYNVDIARSNAKSWVKKPACIRQAAFFKSHPLAPEHVQLPPNRRSSSFPAKAAESKVRGYYAVTRHPRGEWITFQRLANRPTRFAPHAVSNRLISTYFSPRNFRNRSIYPHFKFRWNPFAHQHRRTKCRFTCVTD